MHFVRSVVDNRIIIISYLNLAIIFSEVFLTFPLVWLGRLIVDRKPTISRVLWITTFVHWGLGFTFGIPITRAILTQREWYGWPLPIPRGISLILVIQTGVMRALVVLNRDQIGFGAPFFIALSQKLALAWFYARTRNPMVLAALAFLVTAGMYYQSVLFIVWVLLVFTPTLLFFIKVYEERELELRFGASYLAYKASTPMLITRRKSN